MAQEALIQSQKLCRVCAVDYSAKEIKEQIQIVSVAECPLHNSKAQEYTKMKLAELKYYLAISKDSLNSDSSLSLGEKIALATEILWMQNELDSRR